MSTSEEIINTLIEENRQLKVQLEESEKARRESSANERAIERTFVDCRLEYVRGMDISRELLDVIRVYYCGFKYWPSDVRQTAIKFLDIVLIDGGCEQSFYNDFKEKLKGYDALPINDMKFFRIMFLKNITQDIVRRIEVEGGDTASESEEAEEEIEDDEDV